MECDEGEVVIDVSDGGDDDGDDMWDEADYTRAKAHITDIVVDVWDEVDYYMLKNVQHTGAVFGGNINVQQENETASAQQTEPDAWLFDSPLSAPAQLSRLASVDNWITN